MNNFGVYIHIPFCKHKCGYCDFYSIADKEELASAYVDSLCKEIKRRSKLFDGKQAGSIFFGGGTPSLLAPTLVAKIINTVKANLTLDNDAEITIEMNPESVTPDKLKGYIDTGVNRASIGVQSINDDELNFLERIHTSDEAKIAVEMALEAKFKSVSLDMIYALPGQTLDKWLGQLKEVMQWGTNAISCYELTPERGTPLWNIVESGKVILPANKDDFFDSTEEFLQSKKFDHYEISNYATKGHECRHNMGVWEYGDYMGVGAGAHGKAGRERWGNIKSVEKYIERLESGKNATETKETLADEMIRIERLMQGLRLKRGIATDDTLLTSTTQTMINDGFLIIENGRLMATARGWRILDSVLEKL